MQIRKIYRNINPGLLYDDVKDFASKQGLGVDQEKQETYSIPTNSSSSIRRGVIIFKGQGKTGDTAECLRVHIEGSDSGETKMILDINTDLFPQDKITAFQSDLDFIFSSHEK